MLNRFNIIVAACISLTVAFWATVAPAVAAPANDPFFQSKGAWKQSYDDQWALKRIGFDDAKGAESA